MNLGNRLVAIANLVPLGARLADIGTDHAYLPAKLVESGIVPFAIAGDVHQGPFEAARDTISTMKLEEKIDLRLGDGLMILRPGEVDTVVIAGMGGATITGILESGKDVVAMLRRIIVQPMVGAAIVRLWLVNNGWHIENETLVREDGKLYQIIAAQPGNSEKFEPILYDIGPILWNSRHQLLQEHIIEILEQSRWVLSNMAGSQSARQSGKYKEYSLRIKQLEEKLQCL